MCRASASTPRVGSTARRPRGAGPRRKDKAGGSGGGGGGEGGWTLGRLIRAAKKIEALPPRPRRSSGGCERRAVATRALLSGLVSPRATRRLRGTRRDVLGQSFRARRPTAPSKVRPEVLRVAG